MKKQRRITKPDHQVFIIKLTYLKDEAARLGLWRTMHKLDAAVKEVGWEISDIITGKQKCTKSKSK